MSTIRHSPKTPALCYVTIRAPFTQISWNHVRFEDQKPYFTAFGKMDRKSIYGQKSFIPHLLVYWGW